MSDTIYCPECGQSLSATARFCGRCGHMLPAVQGTADGGRRTGTQGAAARGVLPLLLGAGVVLVFVGLIVAGWFLGQALVGRGGPGRGNGEEAALVGGDGQEETGGGEEEALPAETALPTVTLAPTETVAPTATDTPKPTATSEPTSTLAPTGTPEPTSTATRATTTGALFSEAAFCAEPCSASGSNSSRVFPGGIDIIYAQWRYENVRVGARYERIWESNGQVWAHYDCTWPGPTASLENIQLTDPSGLRSGEWKVTIRIDGEVAMEEAITLTGNSTHWDVPGYFDTCYGRR